jgi:hypothetical protein
MNSGLIGTWSPGIGDPSVGGWLTVALYFGAAALVWGLLRRWPRWNTGQEIWFWKLLLIALVLLGINKQLDLQSAFTEAARLLAVKQGWYAERRQAQLAFVAGGAIMGLTLLAATMFLIWGAPRATHWALVGSASLVLFVLVRATSIHHVDAFLGRSLAGIRVNWLLEWGGLLLIGASAWRRRGQH